MSASIEHDMRNDLFLISKRYLSVILIMKNRAAFITYNK